MKRLLIIAVFAMLAACAGHPQQDNAARLGTKVAVAHFIQRAEVPAERAQRVAAIAREALARVGDSQTSVELIEQAVRQQIPWQRLSLVDQQLADELVVAIRMELQARVGNGLLAPDQKIAVATVLGWVLETAEMRRG